MEKVKWTNEQALAINEKDSNILVAAAAGSGKTAVLVERIIHRIIQDKLDIDKMLVVTFTNAAASEMRQRVLEAIYKKIEEEPENKHLQRQIVLLAKSNISTIHSFCLEVMRNNFFEIDISPNFKIGEQAELEILKQEVLEELFENKYEAEDEEFIKLLNTYTGYREDEPLKQIVLNIYSYIQSMPFPKKWLDEKIEMFNEKNDEEDFGKTIWGSSLIKSAKDDINFFVQQLRVLEKELSKFKELEKFLKIIKIDIANLEEISKLETWDKLYEAINNLTFDRWPTDKKITNPLKNDAKDKRDKIKDDIKKIKEKIFFVDSKQAKKDIEEMYYILKSLKNIVFDFIEEYSKAKKEKNIIDFNDIEHFALNILVKEDEHGNITTSYIAKKYQEKFAEIAIDEYQDSNMVQEYILLAISKGNNMFMVGDVKQSIYKFRQACPELFLQKYESYKLIEEKKDNDNLKIQLFKNFRSRENVLDFTNLIFQDIMSKELGDIDYNKDEYLNLGADYPKELTKESVQTQIQIIDANKNEDDLKTEYKEDDYDENEDEENEEEEQIEIIENSELEAKWVANEIKKLLNSDMQVYDRKRGYRKLTYKDIVILLRSTKFSAPIFEQEISNLGFPVFSDTSSGYLDTVEIDTIISVLKIIDNPIQDVPMCTVLRSIIGGFTDNELIEIKMINKDITLYESMLKYENLDNANIEIKNKIDNFLQKIEDWRKKSEYIPLDELVWLIYKDTGYYNYVSLLPGGELKIANLKLLFEKAKQYQETSFKGLFNFIQFIEKLKKNNGDFGGAKLIGENDDVIRIMSIHKSKGLEFPIVFLSGTGKKFNLQDLNNKILLHQNLGIGPEYINAEKGIRYNTLPKENIKRIAKLETISEEMRILYVALTRAKEKLIITGVSKNIQKELEEKRVLLESNNSENGKINKNIVNRCNSYLDWIELVMLNNQNNSKDYFTLNIQAKEEILKNCETKDEKEENLYEKIEDVCSKVKLDNKYIEKLSWKYPYDLEINIPTKSSVTKLKENNLQDVVNINYPKFMQEEIEVNSARKGSLIHLCMQRLDETKDYTYKDIQELVNNMENKKIITKKEAECIDINKIMNFIKSNIWQEIKNAKEVYREKPFYINIKAKEIYDVETEENILVQGIIDLYYITKKDEIVLVDYKTDYVENKNEEILKEKYRNQLEIYKRALESALNKKVDKVYIYSTFLNKEISL